MTRSPVSVQDAYVVFSRTVQEIKLVLALLGTAAFFGGLDTCLRQQPDVLGVTAGILLLFAGAGLLSWAVRAYSRDRDPLIDRIVIARTERHFGVRARLGFPVRDAGPGDRHVVLAAGADRWGAARLVRRRGVWTQDGWLVEPEDELLTRSELLVVCASADADAEASARAALDR